MTSLPLYNRTRRKRLTPEASLQMAVVEHMRLNAMPGCWCMSVPNDGKRTPATALHLKRMGMLPGAADLFINIAGEAPHFLELKAKGGKQSPEQIAFQELCSETGAWYYVATGIDEALSILMEWGALKPYVARRRLAA